MKQNNWYCWHKEHGGWFRLPLEPHDCDRKYCMTEQWKMVLGISTGTTGIPPTGGARMAEHTSWSEIDTARQCLKKHELRYKQGWRPKQDAQALITGTDWHTLLNSLYTSGDPKAPLTLLKQWRDEGEDVELLTWMLDGYYEQWGPGDPLWSKNVVAVEMEIRVPLPDVGYGQLELLGYIDLIVSWNGKLWVVDHKSGKNAPKKRDLELADQWTLYVWALQQLGYDVFGSVHSYAKTAQLKRPMTLRERYSRTPIHRTPREVEAVAREAAIQAAHAKSSNGAPKSPSDRCHWRCEFFDVCLTDRRIGPEMAENILRATHQKDEETE